MYAKPDGDPINNNSGHSRSVWMETHLPTFPSLTENLSVDVCIVGAGIVGLTCAYTLAKQGKSVAVVDQGPLAGGQTARTTAHLSYVLEERYYKLITTFGEKQARLILQSHSSAIDYIEKIVKDEAIDCDFERLDGYLFVPPKESTDVLDKELLALRTLGKQVDKMAICPLGSSFDVGPCLLFPKQGQFHILKYLKGLTEAILKYKGKIFCDTHVSHVEDGTSCTVKTEAGYKITAQSVIIATGSPINNRFYIHTKQEAYRTYVIAASIPKSTVHKGLYWDTADPYNYIRTHQNQTEPDLEWLIIGGQDHKTGQDDAIETKYKNIEKWAKARFSMIGKIEYHWSGQIFTPIDQIAYIGRNPGDKNIYIATGDAGNGMTFGTIAGMLLPDLILKKRNLWEEIYKPSRKTLSAAGRFIHNTLNVMVQYRDWLTPGEMQKLELLPLNEGMILRNGIKKIAVYKDEQNNIHMNSAFCPHLGGCVRWNPLEKSWDCPCHGSRFSGCGRVMNGPAIKDLAPCHKTGHEKKTA